MLSGGGRPVHAQSSDPESNIGQSESQAEPSAPQQEPALLPDAESALLPDPVEAQTLPLATDTKGERPQSDPSVLPEAADELPPENTDLTAPASLALPDNPSQVRIRRLRPLSLGEVETIAEVNNPNLKAIALQVQQAQSALRAQIALWYPKINLNITSFPTYTAGQQSTSGDSATQAQQGSVYTSITSSDGCFVNQLGFDLTYASSDCGSTM